MSPANVQDPPRYGTLQVEITSHCNLRCHTCVADELREQWESRHLSPQALARIEAIAPRCDSIHLQGWGESLLRDDLPDLIRRLKAHGCRVTLSTNGTIMDVSLAHALIDAGLDSMAFSLAGATAATQDPLRGAGTFDSACDAIRTFIAQRGSKKQPPVLVNYLLTPRNLQLLHRAVILCAGLGIDRLQGTHMVHVCCREQQQLIGYLPPGARGQGFFFSRALALLRGVSLWLPPMQPELVPLCEKNPLHNFFIGADGSLSPCVFLNPPLRGPFPLIRQGHEHTASRYILGNLNKQGVDEIWLSEEYQRFRQAFEQRLTLYETLLAGIPANSEGAQRLERAVDEIKKRFASDLLPPEPCRGCAQLLGF